ncbi:MAG: DUF4336 domain-containing protein [Hyphomicrobiales bacterium]
MELETVDDDIWLAEGRIVSFYGFAYPTRSVIVRLGDGGLWIWSPVELTPELQHLVDGLGDVAHLVSPNKIHHLYLQDWSAAYPDARLWGPQSTIAKRGDLSFQSPLEDASPPAWADTIDQVWFRGSPLLDEVVFFHRSSATAILADLSENFDSAFLDRHWTWWQRPIARLWKITVGYGYAPLEWRLSFIDRKPARDALDRMLAWDPRRVVMAHGEWQRTGGRAYLERAFAWLG